MLTQNPLPDSSSQHQPRLTERGIFTPMHPTIDHTRQVGLVAPLAALIAVGVVIAALVLLLK